MKYLAILRDSFRESLDSKVIYFTVGLSLLLFVFLFLLDIRPVTVEEEAELAVSRLNSLVKWQNVRFGKEGISEEDVPYGELVAYKQTDQNKPPWESGYRLVIRLHLPESFTEPKREKDVRTTFKRILEGSFQWLNAVVREQKTQEQGNAVDYVVTSKGSNITRARDWRHEPSLFFGAIPMPVFRMSLSRAIYILEDVLVNGIGAWVIILVGVIITAFFIPNMLEKGSVDLLLAKPITRVGLLVLKYIGGLTFVFLNSLIAIGGAWLIIGVRTGIWTYSFPLTILVITFYFAILYSVSALFGVLTRSSVLSIFMTCLVWFLLFLLGWGHSALYSENMENYLREAKASTGTSKSDVAEKTTAERVEAFRSVLNVFHTVLPRTRDLTNLTTELTQEELLSESERRQMGWDREVADYNWFESAGVSLAFIVVMLSLACWRFAVRDY